MTRNEALKVLARLEAVEKGAMKGPWYSAQDDHTWQLFGAGTGMMPLQIAKAPKKGTPYAEYWPDAGDDAVITVSRNAFPALLSIVRRVVELHSGQDVHASGETRGACLECLAQAEPCATLRVVLEGLERVEGR